MGERIGKTHLTYAQGATAELVAMVRERIGPVAAFREARVVQRLPKTRSGKILRRLLRARELGLASGDLSALETDDSEKNRD